MGDKNLYKIVEEILTKYPETRSDDKKLIWQVWTYQHVTKFGGLECISYKDFMTTAVFPDTITRLSRDIRKNNPKLDGNDRAKSVRKNRTGTEMYRKRIVVFNNDDTVSYKY